MAFGATGSAALMPRNPEPLTVAQAVRRAVEAVDSSGGVDAGLGELLARFENHDEPIGAPEEVRALLDEEVGALDPEGEDGAIQMAGAVATYLAYRRDEADDDPADLLRLAARAEFEAHPPEPVARWLAEAGIAV
jgi:hypothetical protein